MATKNQDGKDRDARQGGHAEPGRPFQPQDLPKEEAPKGPTAPKVVPLGLPISDEEYRKQKREAVQGKPRAKSAQEDPSGSRKDDET